MCKHYLKLTSFPLILILFFISFSAMAEASSNKKLILDSSTENIDVYSSLYILKNNKQEYMLDDVIADEFKDEFVIADKFPQHTGFFEVAKWLRMEVDNQSDKDDWLLEFAFPLIYYLNIYTIDQEGQLLELAETGADFPFNQRQMNHRNFVFNFKINPNTTTTFYILVHAGGDLHPPINIWEPTAFIGKTQKEFMLLGLFYGMIFIMILYNLFLYFSLRLQSYLYYVLAISATLMGQLSINGFAYQYIWSNSPFWNLISTPFWVSLACIFILIFTRSFLDADKYFPQFKILSYMLMVIHFTVIITLFISHITALNLMLFSTLTTFIAVLSTAFICLKRGARQARFFIVGWVVFLIGIFVTIIERAAILPYSELTEYAGQAALVFEVVILSFALADKINIMRTEKHLAEIEVKESQQLAIRSLKKTDELKDEFLAITSHEIRTPLYGMIGIAESIYDGITGDVSDVMKEQLSMIISSGNRLTSLVNDILDFSKLKHDSLDINIKPVLISDLVNVILTICKPLIKKKPIRLINKIDSTNLSVYADQNRLQQILYNLIGNAIKYTDYGEISVSAEEKGDLITINVTDTGKGISEELQQFIFNPFTQGDTSLSREASGTGIGLSITKQLVDLHGGSLEVKSKIGVGSTFSFTLPVNKHVITKNEIATTIAPLMTDDILHQIDLVNTTPKLAKILVVDDEPVNLQVLTNQLILEGYEVITASNGEEVLTIIDEESIDLLILDVMMPKMSGYEVCLQLRKKYSIVELPILMLTAKSQIRDRITAFEVGANDYLAKPCDKQELLSRVKTLVRLRSLNLELIMMNAHLEEKVIDRTKELKIANDDLLEMNNDLITMSESRKNLLANIAHELGTPVTLINSYVQAIQQGLVATDDPYFTTLVYEKIKVLSRLISDLSDLSKLEAGQSNLNFTQINIGIWLKQVVKQLEFDIMRYDRKFDCIKDLGELKKYRFMIDIQRMDQVLSNLVWNAVKNTPKQSGEIIITATIDDFKQHLIIAITDNGYGIHEDNIPYLFDRFFIGSFPSDKDNQNGSGLGLAIVKEIVQGHEGSISVESKLKIGTTFYISLPLEAIE